VKTVISAWLAGRGSRHQLPRDAVHEPMRGCRAWQVVDGKDGPNLASWWQSTLWPMRRELQSGCHMHGSRPAAHHVCGIHAFAAREDALAYVHSRRDVPMLFARTPARSLGIAIGRVSGWGRVVRHAHGWRSQFAYPFDLFLLAGDRALARSLADRYAVETMTAAAAKLR
jgi:hypothetical protein